MLLHHYLDQLNSSKNSMSSRGQGYSSWRRGTRVRISLWSLNHFQGCSLISCIIHIAICPWRILCRRGRPDYKNPDCTGVEYLRTLKSRQASLVVPTCNLVGMINGGLAQLARATALHAVGHRFESDILHNKNVGLKVWACFLPPS